MFLLILVIVLFVLWMGVRRWRQRKLIQLYEQFKWNKTCLPFIGHGLMFLGSNEDRMNQLISLGKKSYESGGIIGLWLGVRLYFMVTNAETAKSVLKNCLEKDDIYDLLKILVGNGSAFAPVSIWRPRRKAVAPKFTQKNLNHLMPIFARKSHILADQLKDTVGKSSFALWKYIAGYTMDSVCETTLGVKSGELQDPHKPLIHSIQYLMKVAGEVVCKIWLHYDVILRAMPEFRVISKHIKFMHDYVHQIVQSKQSLRNNKQEKNASNDENPVTKMLIETLMETTTLDAVEICEETLVMILAGTDTSAVGIGFIVKMLAEHPKVQDTCYEELQAVYGDSDRPVTVEDLPYLKYLGAVIKESLRLYPPLPIILRKIEEDLTLPCGTTLVAPCGVLVSIYGIHRNPAYWGADADQFKPERFLESDVDPAAFMAFSYGPRGCVGNLYSMMSLKTVIATLLRRYRLLSAEHRTNGTTDGQSTAKPMRIQFDIMMKDVNNFEIKLEHRSSRDTI